MSRGYMVKGSTIKSKFEFVCERFGDEAEKKLIKHLANNTGLFPILDMVWYPFALYDEVNRAIANLFFEGDLARLEEVGAFSANKALRSTYKVFAQGKDFVQFLQSANTYHQTFYSSGDVKVQVAPDHKSAAVEFSNLPQVSQADLHITAGFYKGAGRFLGINNMNCKMGHSPSGASLKLSWS